MTTPNRGVTMECLPHHFIQPTFLCLYKEQKARSRLLAADSSEFRGSLAGRRRVHSQGRLRVSIFLHTTTNDPRGKKNDGDAWRKIKIFRQIKRIYPDKKRCRYLQYKFVRNTVFYKILCRL